MTKIKIKTARPGERLIDWIGSDEGEKSIEELKKQDPFLEKFRKWQEYAEKIRAMTSPELPGIYTFSKTPEGKALNESLGKALEAVGLRNRITINVEPLDLFISFLCSTDYEQLEADVKQRRADWATYKKTGKYPERSKTKNERISASDLIGLDDEIKITFKKMKKCLAEILRAGQKQKTTAHFERPNNFRNTAIKSKIKDETVIEFAGEKKKFEIGVTPKGVFWARESRGKAPYWKWV